MCAFEFAVVGSAERRFNRSISAETALFNNIEQTLFFRVFQPGLAGTSLAGTATNSPLIAASLFTLTFISLFLIWVGFVVCDGQYPCPMGKFKISIKGCDIMLFELDILATLHDLR